MNEKETGTKIRRGKRETEGGKEKHERKEEDKPRERRKRKTAEGR